MSNPFDYATAILQTKKQLIVDDLTEREYQPFLVNRALSQHNDCVMYANEMNRRHHLDKKMQNDFLLNTIRSMKRPFAKWAKAEKNDDLECINWLMACPIPKQEKPCAYSAKNKSKK